MPEPLNTNTEPAKIAAIVIGVVILFGAIYYVAFRTSDAGGGSTGVTTSPAPVAPAAPPPAAAPPGRPPATAPAN